MHKEELKDQFRQLMGHYPTGVTIVTTMDWKKNIPSGLTVNSFTSVSMEPTLVLFCVDKSATSLSSFQQANRFAVHLLASDQEKECFEFASKSKDKFSQVHFHISKRGLPIIESALGVMECKRVNEIEAGDHFIFIGEVEHVHKNNREPLLYWRGKTGALSGDWMKYN